MPAARSLFYSDQNQARRNPMSTAEKIQTPRFDDSVKTIKQKHEFKFSKQNSWFRVGNQINLDGHASEKSLLIIAYGALKDLTIYQTFCLFGEYADMVEQGDTGHPNVRALYDLYKKHGDKAKIAGYIEFQNNENPLQVKKQNGENACGNG